MPMEVGQILKGTVIGVKKFGAFIKLPDGSNGLCHISEISNEYIKDLSTHLTMNQSVDVKIIGIDKSGKINLSIKQTTKRKPVVARKEDPKKDFENLMNDFIKSSEEKMKTIKNGKNRRGNGFNTRKYPG